MLTGTVDAGKWFFVEQALKIMAAGNFFHNFHHQLVVVGSDICSAVNWRHFMLGGSHFVVLCLGENTEFPQFVVQLFHKCGLSFANRTKVVVVQFLAFRRHGAEQSPSGENKVVTL